MESFNKKEVIEKTKAFVRSTLQDAEGGHDWFHIERVYKNALLIGRHEKADLFIVALGALLHDIADYKFFGGDETIGPKKAKNFLESLDLPQEIIEEVVSIIENVSFKGGNFETSYNSKELAVVQDADRLDALGAIGIARTFNYGGFKNRKIYDPEIKPDLNMTPEQYKKSSSPTINHFYEKLLLLKDRMNTPTGKKLAENRHRFMKDFLKQFYEEWEGSR